MALQKLMITHSSLCFIIYIIHYAHRVTTYHDHQRQTAESMVRQRAPPRLPSRPRHNIHDVIEGGRRLGNVNSTPARVKNTSPSVSSSRPTILSGIPESVLKALLYFCTVLFLVILISSHQSLPVHNQLVGDHGNHRLPVRLRQAFAHNHLQYNRQQNLFTGIVTPQAHRIAIVLPFIGTPESIPPYLELFCTAAGGSASLVDFLILHPGVLDSFATRNNVCPPNVKFVNLHSMENFASKLLRVMDFIPQEDWVLDNREIMIRVLTKYLTAYPYALVEYKPTFGHVFAEFLDEYSHWGYSDVDIVFGDLSRWITQEELQDFDIVTYGYGDQNRVYLRGQFTFHRNIPKINQLWRKCEYLSHLDQRFSKVLSGEQKLKFESAEGCYSSAILERQDIRVKYAVKAFTDTRETDTVYSHGLYVSLAKHIISSKNRFFPYSSRRDEEHHTKNVVIYKAHSAEDGYWLQQSSPNWFEHDSVYADLEQPLQWEVGRKEILELNDPKEKANCMYWAQKKYQSRLCVSSNVTEQDTVFWVNGRLYKQRYQNAKLENNVATAPFFHFQEWKRYYRYGQLASFRPDADFSTFVLTKEGAIPVYPRQLKIDSVASRHSSNAIKSPLGKSILHWKAGNAAFDRGLLPRRNYCLQSAPRKFPPIPPAPECLQQVSWWDHDQVHILSMAPAWQTDLDPKFDVTLVMTLQVPIYQSSDPAALNSLLDVVITNLNRWQGQSCVLVFHIAVDDLGQRDDVLLLMEARLKEKRVRQGTAGTGKADETMVTPEFGTDSCLIAATFADLSEFSPKDKKKKSGSSTYHVSRKALLNMAVDAVPTRWFASGLELERGMMLSMDAALFAHRAAISHQNIPGNLFWIPQFALEIEDDANQSLTLSNLIDLKKKGVIKAPIDFEKGLCERPEEYTKPENIFAKAAELWWEIADSIAKDDSAYITDESLTAKRAKVQDDVQLRLIELLADEKHYDLFAMDESPIFLTDNEGAHNGMYVFEIAREVEEFGGKLCYNGLRPAQLATWGYNINILPGAFAASTVSSRLAAYRNGLNAGGLGEEDEIILGGSRCDGCFMFDEEHESILESIAKDERKRPAKAAVLWSESGFQATKD